MRTKRKRVRSKPRYSLIIKDHMIRFIEMKRPIEYGVHTFKERALPEGVVSGGKITNRNQLESILQECVKEWKLKRKKILFTVPDPIVVLRKLELPGELDNEDIRAHLYMEFGNSIHLPFDDPVFDFHLNFRNELQTEILLFAAPEQIIAEYVSLFEECGMRPIVAEISSLAMYRLYLTLDLATKVNTMVIQLDLNGVNISIFKSHRPYFIRQVSTNWLELIQHTEQFKTEPGMFQDVLVEVERTMNFYQYSLHNGEQSVDRIVLIGDHPLIDDFYQELNQVVTLPIDPFYKKELRSSKGDMIPCQYFVNIGLALKEVSKS